MEAAHSILSIARVREHDSAAAAAPDPLVEAAGRIAQELMSDLDGSHDFEHVRRVRAVASAIAREEGVANMQAVQIAALLHDVGDYKYFADGEARLEKALAELRQLGLDPATEALVVAIINGIGFKEELKQLSNGQHNEQQQQAIPLELACCQDADRLDAIGAIGIARCFTFGGAR